MEAACQLRLSDHVFRDDDLTRHPAHPQGFLFQRVPQTQLRMGIRPEMFQAMAYNYEQQLQNELEMLEREIYGDLKKEIFKKSNEDKVSELPEPQTNITGSRSKSVEPTRRVDVKLRLPEKRSCSSKKRPVITLPERDFKKSGASQAYQCENTMLAVSSAKRQIQRNLVCINNSLLLGYKREPIDPLDAQRQVRRSMEFKTRISRELYHFRRVVESVMEQKSKLPVELLLKRCLGVYRRAAHLLSEILKHLPDYEERDVLLATVKEILSLVILLQQDKDFTNFLIEWSREAKVIKSKDDRKMQTLNLRLKDDPALKSAAAKENLAPKNHIKENRAPKKVVVKDNYNLIKAPKQNLAPKNRIQENPLLTKTFEDNHCIDDIVDKVDKRLLNRLGPVFKRVSEFIDQQKVFSGSEGIERIPGWHGFAEVSKKNLNPSSSLQHASKENQLPVANRKTKSSCARAAEKTLLCRQSPDHVGRKLQEDVEMHQLQQIMCRIEEMEKEEDAIRRRLGEIQYEAVSSTSLVLSRIPQYNNVIEENQTRSVVVYSPGYEARETQPSKTVPLKHGIKKTKDSRVKLKIDADRVDEIETGQLRFLKYLQLTQHLNRTPSVPVQQVQSVSESIMMSIWKEVEHEINATLMDMADTVVHDELWSTM